MSRRFDSAEAPDIHRGCSSPHLHLPRRPIIPEGPIYPTAYNYWMVPSLTSAHVATRTAGFIHPPIPPRVSARRNVLLSHRTNMQYTYTDNCPTTKTYDNYLSTDLKMPVFRIRQLRWDVTDRFCPKPLANRAFPRQLQRDRTQVAVRSHPSWRNPKTLAKSRKLEHPAVSLMFGQSEARTGFQRTGVR